jgi:hypothetical protein
VPLVTAGTPDLAGVTATSGTADYGAWAELVASTGADWWGFQISNYGATGAFNASGFDIPGLLSIGIGGAGSEVELIGDIEWAHRNSARGQSPFVIPLFVPKGSRVAFRVSSDTNARTLILTPPPGLIPARGFTGIPPLTRATPFVAPSSQRGVTLTPGAAWTEVVASTPAACEAMLIGIGANDSSMGNSNRTVDVAVGAAGSEIQAWSCAVFADSGENNLPLTDGVIPIALPAGVRIAARCTTDVFAVTVHGLS